MPQDLTAVIIGLGNGLGQALTWDDVENQHISQ